MDLEAVFEQLASRREASVGALDADVREALTTLGVPVRGGVAVLDDAIELLAPERIRRHVGEAAGDWLGRIEIRPHIDSTNSELMRRAPDRSIDGVALLAEVQTGGRGRRGRGWSSPFGRNLALSLGVRLDTALAELGAVSLAVGVAVVDALEEVAVSGVSLKWPNDVLLQGRKLCGVLIELPRAVEPPEIVVGIGINIGGADTVARTVDQGVADVVEQVPDASRNRIAGRVISAVFEVCRRFERSGFGPIKPRYDALHQFHERPARVVSGRESVAGVVEGVGLDGTLRLRTASGVRVFHGGEVSLRA